MGLGRALVALGDPLADDGDLAEVAGGAALHEGHVGRQAHPVDVGAGGAVVKGVHDEVELLEEVHAVVGAERK